jgi:hypothetical protein
MEVDDGWCFAWLAGHGDVERATALRRCRWAYRSVIPVRFLDGEPALRARVERFAGEWTRPGRAALTFDFQSGAPAAVRISFSHPGRWCALGTTVRHVEETDIATLNLGGLDERTPDRVVRQAVLHGFGHVLGMVHEWPLTDPLLLRGDVLVEELRQTPHRWSPEIIERHMLSPLAAGETQHGPRRRSIMTCPIPARWMRDHPAVLMGHDLSAPDKDLISLWYP